MIDINEKDVVGIFKSSTIKGSIPTSSPEYDTFKIYFIEEKIQQCECYNSKNGALKVYKRMMLNVTKFTPWQEVLV